MKNSPFKKPKQVLVFNGAQVLIAVFRSLNTASEISGGNLQAISFSCTGRYISTGGFYYRHLHPNIEIEMADLDNLKLPDYDRMCGADRKYHTVKKMAKKRKGKTLKQEIENGYENQD